MLLFSRNATMTGSPRRTMPWAIEITSYVNAHTGLDVSLWAATFGRPLGSIGWSAVVESQAQLAAETDKLLSDGAYLDLLEAGAEFFPTPAADTLRELVHGTPGEPSTVGAVAVLTTAVADVTRMAAAIGWGIEVSQYVEQIIGSPVFFFVDRFATMGQLSWIGISADIAAADAANAKMAGDPGYLAMVAKTEGLFVPGHSTSAQMLRIA